MKEQGGTIYRSGNLWIWKSPPYMENGKEKRIRKSFKTKEEAEAQRDTFHLFLSGEEVNNFIEGLTVRQAYEKWVKVAWKDGEEYITYNTRMVINMLSKITSCRMQATSYLTTSI